MFSEKVVSKIIFQARVTLFINAVKTPLGAVCIGLTAVKISVSRNYWIGPQKM